MRLLVVGAHAADFVWRAGGIIAKTAELGGEVLNLFLYQRITDIDSSISHLSLLQF